MNNFTTKSNFKNARTPCECPFCWKFKKEPRLGRNHLHLIEALADSANQLLINNNLPGVQDRINRIMQVTREIIRSYPENPDFPRCRFRMTNRDRCNLVLIDEKCNIHGTKGNYKQLELDLGADFT